MKTQQIANYAPIYMGGFTFVWGPFSFAVIAKNQKKSKNFSEKDFART